MNKFYYMAAILMSATFLSFFFEESRHFARRIDTAIIVLVILTITVSTFAGVKKVLGEAFPALVFCAICWTGCFLQGKLDLLISDQITHGRLAIETVIILFAAAGACGISTRLLRYSDKAVVTFCILCVATLFVNLGKTIYAATGNMSERSYLKREYSIESELLSPNIFYIHADAMIGISAFEKYYGDPQKEFLSALSERGFLVNKTCQFEGGHRTLFAVTALTCPQAYDALLSRYTVSTEKALSVRDTFFFNQILQRIGRNNEMEKAFCAKKYQICLLGGVMTSGGMRYPAHYPIRGSDFYTEDLSIIQVEEDAFFKEDDFGLLGRLSDKSAYFGLLFPNMLRVYESKERTPFQTHMSSDDLEAIIQNSQNRDDATLVESLNELLQVHFIQPSIVIVPCYAMHPPYDRDKNGKYHEPTRDPADYYEQHIWCGNMLIGMIDMILKTDPDAVIVIQSDHGLNGNTKEELKQAFGENADEGELWNSTMSAIRVPQMYQTGDEHFAVENPLNISRYLVNSFVGKNYDYLPPN